MVFPLSGRILSSKLFPSRLILPFIGGLLYHVISLSCSRGHFIEISAIITLWGMFAYVLSTYGRDPSWTIIFFATLMLFYIVGFFLLDSNEYLQNLDNITFTYNFTYISAKIGCIRNGCCRARVARGWFSPVSFNSFNWLQQCEIAFAIILILLATYLKVKCQPNGISFIAFVWLHSISRIIAYSFRYSRYIWVRKAFTYITFCILFSGTTILIIFNQEI